MARKRAGRKLSRTFFARDSIEVAPDLIGKILVHRLRGNELKARIVETEAYVGPHDLACHASKGRTARTEVMFGRAGHAYVYLIYGMYQMLNIVTGAKGDAQAVLIRAGEPLDGWDADLSGPGKLARAMRISRSQNGLDMTGGELFLLDNAADRPRVVRSKRVGVDYAKEWRDELLRFSDAASAAVSKPRPSVTVVSQAKRF
jgi:DNA-3-methyladenine glycosylase